MQIKIISVPVTGGERENEALNQLLRSKKVIELARQLVSTTDPPMWCFCVKYVEDFSPQPKEGKIDYKAVLDPVTFERYSRLREIRNQLAEAEGLRPYMVFTNADLAEMARHEVLTRAAMSQIKGIGEQKLAKYAAHFVSAQPDAQS